jgi:predicted aspartyl protease
LLIYKSKILTMKKLLFLSAIVLLSSCSLNRMYLTVSTKQQIEKAGVDIKQVQFYNSEEIVLARQLSKGELKVAEGKVRIENGKNIEEIIIPANTPGVCELNDEKTLKVSFDTGDGKSIPFLVERKGDIATSGSYFKIGAKKWVRTSNGKQIGKVDYQGQIYNLVRGANSRLMIDKSVLNKVNRNTHVAKGRKL